MVYDSNSAFDAHADHELIYDDEPQDDSRDGRIIYIPTVDPSDYPEDLPPSLQL